MVCRATAPISTRAPSRPSHSFRQCSTRDHYRVSLHECASSQPGPSQPVHIAADQSRVVTRLFVPGHEGFDQQESRSSAVLRRVLELSDDEVQRSYDDIIDRFEGRHRGLTDTFLRHAHELSDRLDPERQLSPTRLLLLGATFTSEYAIEGAALCNPSMVMHPDQTGVGPGGRRFVMSVRAIGEGHNSSIGFRTGTITGSGDVDLDPTPTFATTGRRDEATFEAEVFKAELRRLRGGGDDADYVLDHLGPRFTEAEMEETAQHPRGPYCHSKTGEEDSRPHAQDRRAELQRSIRGGRTAE